VSAISPQWIDELIGHQRGQTLLRTVSVNDPYSIALLHTNYVSLRTSKSRRLHIPFRRLKRRFSRYLQRRNIDSTIFVYMCRITFCSPVLGRKQRGRGRLFCRHARSTKPPPKLRSPKIPSKSKGKFFPPSSTILVHRDRGEVPRAVL